MTSIDLIWQQCIEFASTWLRLSKTTWVDLKVLDFKLSWFDLNKMHLIWTNLIEIDLNLLEWIGRNLLDRLKMTWMGLSWLKKTGMYLKWLELAWFDSNVVNLPQLDLNRLEGISVDSNLNELT